MEIQINGEPYHLPENSTVADLLALLNKEPRFLAVEKNQQLVPRSQHSTSRLSPQDCIEIVTLVGGG